MPENSNCSGASSCSKESCEGCPSNAKNKAGGGIAKEPMNAASNVKKVIGVVSGKGGVGKSFVTASLAAAMNRAGYKVGIMDADITGPSIPKMFGIHGQVYGTDDGMVPMETENGIKIMSINLLLDDEEAPVIWRGPVIAGVVKQFWNETVWGDVDYLFVDMPPGTGDVPLTVFQSLPVDGIVIVTSPQELVQMIVKKAYNMAEMMHVPVCMSSRSWLTSAWQTMMQLTCISSARRIISGWSPQMTMLSRLEKSKFSRHTGSAMVTSPEIESRSSPSALRILPSSTESRL